MIFKVILLIVLLLNPFLIDLSCDEGDTITVSKEELKNIYYKVTELERSDSLKTEKIKIQTQIIDEQELLIKELHQLSMIDSTRVELYKERSKLMKPK